jgi:hypothetical protein
MQARIVEHVFQQLWPEHGKPTHPEDVDNLRDTIAEVVAHTLGYLDDHAEHQRWVDEGQRSQSAE